MDEASRFSLYPPLWTALSVGKDVIAGIVTAYREAVISVTVRGLEKQAQEVEAVIDTGFDGWLTLPASLVANLRLPWRRRSRARLADGSEVLFDVYEATVIWDGSPRRIAVDCVDSDPLIGMSLLDGYELTVQVIDGGRVGIKALP
ncbi:MAG: clan AA aspartic protease [Gemmatimonadota bacterium]|nr:clan AA aspartic protease [Gemmatimonadota bacterium]